jgi:hypothetical protein
MMAPVARMGGTYSQETVVVRMEASCFQETVDFQIVDLQLKGNLEDLLNLVEKEIDCSLLNPPFIK